VAANWNDAADQQALGPQRSSGRLIGLFIVLAVVIIAAVIVRPYLSSREDAKQPALGKPFTLLQLEPLQENGKSLSAADLRGKVTLINFWGPWCPPCRTEFPELMNLRERFAKQADFQFVSVTCMHDANEANLPQQTEAFLQSKGYDLPVHRDPMLTTRLEVLRLNEEQGFAYPTTLLIDQQGIVRGVWVGYSPGIAEKMRKRIDGLLAAGGSPLHE
jgi:cytochrome c biogenesis protein CcmG, thiol:disulfide interchange protein DsbE